MNTSSDSSSNDILIINALTSNLYTLPESTRSKYNVCEKKATMTGIPKITKLPPTPPITHRIVVGTLAVLAGAYVVYDTSRDFAFIKFEPHSAEELEKRKKQFELDGKDNWKMTTLEVRTLDYTPEAKERLQELLRK